MNKSHHGCIVEEIHRGVHFTSGSVNIVCGMQTNKSVHICLHTPVNSVIGMFTVYRVHVILY